MHVTLTSGDETLDMRCSLHSQRKDFSLHKHGCSATVGFTGEYCEDGARTAPPVSDASTMPDWPLGASGKDIALKFTDWPT